MTHRSADRLSDAIDDYLGGGAGAGSHLGDVLDALAGAFPDVSADDARERVRRRVAGFRPDPTGAPEVLAERAIDELRSLQRRLTQDDYVPWPTVVGALALAGAAVGIAIYLRRRGDDESEVATQ